MNEANDFLSDIEKERYDLHMNDVKFIVLEKLNALNVEETEMLRNIDILQYGRNFVDEMGEMRNQNVRDEALLDFTLDGIYRIMAAYYLIFSGKYPGEESYNQFLELEAIIIHLDEIRRDLLALQPGPSRRIGVRRWRVHPVSQARETDGYYNRSIPVLAEYGK